jgi:tetratricopeptide (TPR) repeat protein
MSEAATRQNALCNEALAHEKSGRLDLAVGLWRQAVAQVPENPVPYMFLGYALEQSERDEAACAVYSLATDRDPRVINAWRGRARDDVALRSRAADRAIRRWFTQLHRRSLERWSATHAGARVERIRAAIWCQTHEGPFEYRHRAQRPHVFYVPDLPPIAVFDTQHAPWLSVLAEAWRDIRTEFEQAADRAAAHEQPYLDTASAPSGEDWQPLAGTTNWASLHLYRRSEPAPSLLALFPRTMEVLERLPLLELHGRPREVLFSVLKGGQRIPPHYGLANTDATVHLPLIVPGPAALEVAGQTLPWSEGAPLAFDDSFHHQSWNDADAPRVTLLFEAWHPALTSDEQAAVSECFAARERWNETRNRYLSDDADRA